MADANVALTEGVNAQFINPAGLAALEGAGWGASLLIGRAVSRFDRASSAGGDSGTYRSETSYPLVPSMTIGYGTGRWAVGLSLDVPYGTGIEWPNHAWETTLGSYRLDIAKEASASVSRLGPAIAWRFDNGLALGARVYTQRVRALERNDLYRVEGDGTSAGYQLGVRYQAERFVVGSAYSSRTDTELEGKLSDIHPVAAPALTAGDVSVHILYPDRWQTGIAFRLTPTLWWEFDLDWIGWSYVDELSIEQADGRLVNAGKNARRNDDTLSYRTGLKWRMHPALVLHAGLGYDPYPLAERDVSPTVSAVRKTRVGFGGVYAPSRDIEFGFAYQFIYGHARTVTATDQDNLGALDTHLYEGTYRTRTHAIGVTATGTF